SPDYFRTMHIPLVSGRLFEGRDGPGAGNVAILNQAIAKRRCPGQDAVGRRISFDQGRTWVSVIGIVGDTREAGLDRPAADGIYLALAQNPLLQGTLMAKTRDDAIKLARLCGSALLGCGPT